MVNKVKTILPTENNEINRPLPKFQLNIYKCSLCDNVFSNLEDLNAHIANGLDFCSGFGKLEDDDPQLEMKLGCNIVCDICHTAFVNIQEFENHYKLHQEAIFEVKSENYFLKGQKDLPGVWSEIQKIKNEKIAEEDVSLPYSKGERKFYKQSYYKGSMTTDILGVSRAEINLENNSTSSEKDKGKGKLHALKIPTI